MAFPTSPTDGQIYKEYIYDPIVGAWKKTGAIVEQDSNSHGSYMRFSGGIQICWGTFGHMNVSLNSSGAFNHYRSTEQRTLPAPFRDASSYHVVANWGFSNTNSGYSGFMNCPRGSQTATTFGINFSTPWSYTSGTGGEWMAFGYWK